jgi:hypothetical protein
LAGQFYECANAGSGSDGVALLNGIDSTDVSNAASATRVALGLPINRD